MNKYRKCKHPYQSIHKGTVKKCGHNLSFYDYAIGQQVASFAFQCTLALFLYHRMPNFEEGGLNPLEYVISWQCNLEPPPLLIVNNCLCLDAEANPSAPFVADG